MLGRWLQTAAQDPDPWGALLRVLAALAMIAAALLLAVLLAAVWLILQGAR